MASNSPFGRPLAALAWTRAGDPLSLGATESRSQIQLCLVVLLDVVVVTKQPVSLVPGRLPRPAVDAKPREQLGTAHRGLSPAQFAAKWTTTNQPKAA